MSWYKRFFSGDEGVEFDLWGTYKGHHKVTYKGVKAIRCPNDYVLYQMIVGEVRPDLIIEVGCNEGGGAMYLADLLKLYKIDGMIHAIDIHGKSIENVKDYENITVFTEGWEKYDLNLIKGFKKVMIIEDSAHTYESSIGALLKFSPYVSIGSYMIVEDGIIDALHMSKEYNGGPLRAIREFLTSHNEYEVDRRWCDFFGKNATFNVNGYLRRIR